MAGDSTQTLLNDVLEKAGETSLSPKRATALKYLNDAYLDTLSGSNEFNVDTGEAFPWAISETPNSIVLQAPYDSDGVNLTNGSATGAFTVAPTDSMQGRYLKLTGRPEYFIITAHVGGDTAFTIETEYTDETGTDLGYKAIKLRYEVGTDILRLVSPMNVYRQQSISSAGDAQIYGIDFSTFKRSYPLTSLLDGVPTRFSEIFQEDGATTSLDVLFDKSSQEQTKVDFDYIPYPAVLTDAVDSFPVLPRNDRQVLVYMAVFRLAMDKEDKDKITMYFKLANAKLTAMVEAKNKKMQKTSKNRGKLLARQEDVYSKRKFGRLRYGY